MILYMLHYGKVVTRVFQAPARTDVLIIPNFHYFRFLFSTIYSLESTM